MTIGNLVALGELTTDDATGANGFDAKSTGQQRTSGFVYDSRNRLLSMLTKVNGQTVEDWHQNYDGSANRRIAMSVVNGHSVGIMLRDAAHRPLQLMADGMYAYVNYDVRGRVTRFIYREDAAPANGNVERTLTVDYGYSPEGRVVSRTGTVKPEGGKAAAIGSEEIDEWLDNYESGITPAGPSTSRNKLSSLLWFSPEPGLETICVECAFIFPIRWANVAFDAGTSIFGKGGTRCKANNEVLVSTYETKILGQMKNRGWTQESVEQTIQHPVRVVRVRDIRWKKDRSGRRDDPATAYVRDDGHYVVRNDIDGTIVQVSDRAKAEWKPPY